MPHRQPEELSSDDLYNRFLEAILSFERLGSNNKGLIFLKDNNLLSLKASKGISDTVKSQCAKITTGHCLCGQAAQQKKVIFADAAHADHTCNITSLPHAHYCVPILSQDQQIRGVVTLFLDHGAVYSEKVEQILMASSQVIASIINKNNIKEKLRERTELLSSIYSSADSIALIITEISPDDAIITQFSPGAENMFGYQEQEIIGQSISTLYRQQDQHLLSGRIQTLRQGKKVQSLDITLRKKDGTHFSVVVSITPLARKNGTVTQALGVFNDVSELKQTQLKLEQANSALEQRVRERTQELEIAQQQVLHAEKLAAVGQLSASIAHEFNSPLQGVMAVLKGVSKRAILDDEDVTLVESAVDECNRMAHLIRDLQDFNRPSSGRRAWVNMHQILDSTLLLYKSDFRRKQIQLIKEYAADLPAISVVPDQIRQVIVNLLNNAADACENGGRIEVSTTARQDSITLIIADNGQGIDSRKLQQIFEPFYTTKPAVKGTGLGLSVCYGIIKSHGGTITVESAPEERTAFTITLPIKGKTV